MLADLRLTDHGFQTLDMEYDASKMYTAEREIAKHVRNADTSALQALMEQDLFLQSPFLIGSLELCRIRGIELMSIARSACIESSGGLNWCYYLFYSTVETLSQAHSTDEVKYIVSNALIGYAEAARRDESSLRPQYSPVINATIRAIINMMPCKITVEQIAHIQHLSPKYLSSLFCQETGQTMTDFITEIRVEEAKRLLRSPSLSFSEISNTLNFCSQSYFNSVFKKKTGMTPKQFRLQETQKQYYPETSD